MTTLTSTTRRFGAHPYAVPLLAAVLLALIGTQIALVFKVPSWGNDEPAHTGYELQLVRPGLRLGVQSTVGVDTILGGADARLTGDGLRLGTDAALPPAGGPAAARLGAGLRLGTDPARV